MIKLKRLHKELTHVWSGVGHYHDSSKSLYGYKDYFIKTNDYYMGWNIYKGDKQINPISPSGGMSFKEAKVWLENHLHEKSQVDSGLMPKREFIQNFIKAYDEIMLDKNISQDEKWNKIILARINLTKEVK